MNENIIKQMYSVSKGVCKYNVVPVKPLCGFSPLEFHKCRQSREIRSADRDCTRLEETI